MTTIVTRAGKGSPLTHTEVDTNFTNLNTNKLETGAIALGSAATPSISFTGDTNTGIYSPGADQLAVATNGSARLYIASDGKIGVGTTSPGTELQINATTPTIRLEENSAGSKRLELSVNSSAEAKVFAAQSGSELLFGTVGTERARIDSSGRLLVGTSTTSSSLPKLIVSGGADGGVTPAILVANTDSAPAVDVALGLYDFSAANHSTAARIAARRDGGTWTAGSSQPTRLVFSTTADGASSPTERMRISSGGRLEAWGGSAVNSFNLVTQAAAGTTYYLIYGGYSSSGAGNYGTQSFGVWSNGNVTNTNNSYGAISDIKLKENIVDANSQWNDLKALQVRNYNFKPETNQQNHTQIGLIAQEVELVSPGLVSESPDRDEDGNDLGTVTKSVNYSVLYMKAVKALQEAMERIEVLEQRLNDAGIN